MDAKDVLHEHNEHEHTHKGKWDILPCCPGARIDKIEKEFKEYKIQYIAKKEEYHKTHNKEA